MDVAALEALLQKTVTGKTAPRKTARATLQKAFSLYDKDHSGFIEAREFEDALAGFCQGVRVADVRALFK